MDTEHLKDLVHSMNAVSLAGLKSGQEIGRQEAQAEIKRWRDDCLTLALRLYGESADTFAPETLEVMERLAPQIEARLNGMPA